MTWQVWGGGIIPYKDHKGIYCWVGDGFCFSEFVTRPTNQPGYKKGRRLPKKCDLNDCVFVRSFVSVCSRSMQCHRYSPGLEVH